MPAFEKRGYGEHHGWSSCKAYGTGYQNIPDSTWTVLDMDTLLWDRVGTDMDLTNNRINVSQTGYYLVWGQGVVAYLSDTKKLLVGIFVNGVQLSQNRFTVGAADIAGVGLGTLLKLTAADQVQVRMYHNEGSARQCYGGESGRSLGFHRLA